MGRSHSCAHLIPWFFSLVAAFPGCSLWGVLRNALWGPGQGVGICEEQGHVGDRTSPGMAETSTWDCSAVCMPSQSLSQSPCHHLSPKFGMEGSHQPTREMWFGQEMPELTLTPFSVTLVQAPSHPLFPLLTPVLHLCSPDPWAGGRTRALVPSDRHFRWQLAADPVECCQIF